MEGLVADELLAKAKKKPIYGYALCSMGSIDQITTINPVTLPGQADIIYLVMMYRAAKWHYQMAKADEYIVTQPIVGQSHLGAMQRKEKLEQDVKAGLASVAQIVADYELLKHDERKYREILDYFKMGKKDEHVLRALFVDRVDAYTGEGYSMISMARRWPTIISDFIKMKSEWTDTETIKKNLSVSEAEAVVLKTKNELFKEWKALFFPDVKDRYARIKNLLESRKKMIDEYREWLKPYVQRLKKIKEVAEIRPSADIVNPIVFATSPFGGIRAKIWLWRAIRPEEVGKPLYPNMSIDPYDDFAKKWIRKIEERYHVKFTEKDIRNYIKEFTKPSQKGEILSEHPAPLMDPRHLYYQFIELKYEVDYIKSSTGPLEMEDQYFHFTPFLISQNVLFVFLLELEAKKMAFERYVDELIGVKKVEDRIREEVEREFGEGEEKKEEKSGKGIKDFFSDVSRGVKTIKVKLRPLAKYFIRPAPYEIYLKERVAKTYGDYAGPLAADLVNLVKETCFKLSGQRI